MPVFDVDGDKLHIFENGSGTPIIFVHGSCGGGSQWGGIVKGLRDRYRCVCIDMFGSGKSEAWPLEREWSNLDDERAIGAVLDYLGEPIHLVVHSAGGVYAYPTIKNRREEILSLTLFEPTFFHLLRQENSPLFSEPTAMSNNYRAAIDENNLDLAMAGFVDVWAKKDGVWENLPDPVKDMMKMASNRLYYEWLSPWFEEPSQTDLAVLDLPVLLLKGSETLASMHRICEITQEALPNCRFVEIDGAGHMSPFTHAKIALPEMVSFLSAVR